MIEGTWRKGYQPISQRYNTRGPLQNQGNELSYVQATSFTRYLIDTYSLDTYLGYYIGVDLTNSFEESFGVPYEQAKADWINDLEHKSIEN